MGLKGRFEQNNLEIVDKYPNMYLKNMDDSIDAEQLKEFASSQFIVLTSPRGAFIAALVVSMLLLLRSSLLTTKNGPTCLQRLMNFPKNVDLKKVIDKAQSFQALALETNTCSSLSSSIFGAVKPTFARGCSLSSGLASPRNLNSFLDNYLNEIWRVLNDIENPSNGSHNDHFLYEGKKGSSGQERPSLARAESAPSSIKSEKGNKISRFSVRRRLLAHLTRELGESEAEDEKVTSTAVSTSKNPLSVDLEKGFRGGPSVQTSGQWKSYSEDPEIAEEMTTIFSMLLGEILHGGLLGAPDFAAVALQNLVLPTVPLLHPMLIIQNQMDQVYDIGSTVRAKFIPQSVSQVMGEAVQGAEFILQIRCWICGLTFQNTMDLLNQLHPEHTFERNGEFPWEVDTYLKPFMSEDAFLHSFGRDEDDQDECTPSVHREELLREVDNVKDFAGICLEDENVLVAVLYDLDYVHGTFKKVHV